MIQYPKRYRRIPVRSVEPQHPGRLLLGNGTTPWSDSGSAARLQQPQTATRIEPFERLVEPTEAIQRPHDGRTAPPVKSETLRTARSPLEPITEVDGQSNWHAIATELRAEMDSFRKRQLRQAEEATSQEQERLLRLILPVIDNLERALNHQGVTDHSLRQGVELTYKEFMRLMAAEGVTKVESVGQPFNPNFHEALATQPNHGEPDIVVDEIEAGYRLNDKLLRPAKVVVAA